MAYVHKENRPVSSAVPAAPSAPFLRSNGRPADWRGAKPTGHDRWRSQDGSGSMWLASASSNRTGWPVQPLPGMKSTEHYDSVTRPVNFFFFNKPYWQKNWRLSWNDSCENLKQSVLALRSYRRKTGSHEVWNPLVGAELEGVPRPGAFGAVHRPGAG